MGFDLWKKLAKSRGCGLLAALAGITREGAIYTDAAKTLEIPSIKKRPMASVHVFPRGRFFIGFGRIYGNIGGQFGKP